MSPPTQSSSQSSSPPPPVAPSYLRDNKHQQIHQNQQQQLQSTQPLKAMLFIDGTWLYYSIFRRQSEKLQRCSIVHKFGAGWAFDHNFRWDALPAIICEEIQREINKNKWSSGGGANADRPVEIVRANVFTSMKKETEANSLRMKMFDDMASCNYDVYKMVTEGTQEKCIDIQLAVEMMHFATVPDAYDIAVIVTGDKDFMPALKRTRQKGKRVALVSMRAGCNKSLLDPKSHVRDFDPIWIEDHLDRLIEPKAKGAGDRFVTAATTLKVVCNFLASYRNGEAPVNSRDIGRHLKSTRVCGENLLDQVKTTHGGVNHFLNTHSDVFEVVLNGDAERGFWVSLRDTKNWPTKLELVATKSMMSEEEGNFYFPYKYEFNDAHYIFTENNGNDIPFEDRTQHLPSSAIFNTAESEKVLMKLSVVALRDKCRENELPVSGTKATLVERIVGKMRKDAANNFVSNIPAVIKQNKVNVKVTEYLVGLIADYLEEVGGVVNSRDIGRTLSNAKASGVGDNTNTNTNVGSALQELKLHFGGVYKFLVTEFDMKNYEIEFSESGEDGFMLKRR